MTKDLLRAQSVEAVTHNDKYDNNIFEAVTHNDKYDNNISFERNGERLKSVNKQIGKQLLKEIYPDYDNNEALKENISNFHKEVNSDINPDNNDKHNVSYHNVSDYFEALALYKENSISLSDMFFEPKEKHLSHVSHHQLNQNGNVTTAFIGVPIVKIKISSGFRNLDLGKLYTDITTKKVNVSQDISNDCIELGKKYGLGIVISSSDRPPNADEVLNNNCIITGYAGPGDNKLFRQSANRIRKIWDSKAEPEAETKATLIFKYGNPMFEDMILRSIDTRVRHNENVQFGKLNYNDLKYIEINNLVCLSSGKPTSEWHKFFNETANSNSYFSLEAGKIRIKPTFQQKNDESDATNDDDKTTILDIKCENLNLFMPISNEEYANNNDASEGRANTFINISIPEIFIYCHTNADIDHIMNDASYVITKTVLDSINLQSLPHF